MKNKSSVYMTSHSFIMVLTVTLIQMLLYQSDLLKFIGFNFNMKIKLPLNHNLHYYICKTRIYIFISSFSESKVC